VITPCGTEEEYVKELRRSRGKSEADREDWLPGDPLEVDCSREEITYVKIDICSCNKFFYY
jgi:hypothetical protein